MQEKDFIGTNNIQNGADILSEQAKLRPNEKQAISNIQRYLRTLSYFDPDIPTVPVDSVFDKATKESLTAFQRKYRLSPTGLADRESFDALYSAYLLAISSNGSPLPLPIFPIGYSNYSVTLGAEGFLVEAIQYVIGELAVLNGSFSAPPIERSGIYDPSTEEAIREFQDIHGIYPSGETDLITWNTLVKVFDNLIRDQKQ